MITTPPKEEAESLVRRFDHPELALEHAKWALGHVTKPQTKQFWREVIKELKKLQRNEQ